MSSEQASQAGSACGSAPSIPVAEARGLTARFDKREGKNMRVVTGEAKGRKLKAPKTAGTRPIIDRVKTALFDILSTRVEDARFLDLFAGTGSVGIEALSRGAAQATFIEMNHSVLKLVRENLKITGLGDRAETLQADAFKFLQSNAAQNGNAQRVYDMIYVAPPQYHEMAARALAMLDTSPLLAEDGLVIIQIHPKERSVVAAVPLTRLVLSDERKYGSTLLMFYERVSGQDDGN
ncbi:MAG TPA: 16S rRNA (guanine(966)-N(2))-methyltransferase RsmD [Ktedonobacteraceae bacterium]|nr:16S rRNA (guanine(966)-N(2))-methyltransferase RsmD [Ktedonobacteraceae bacterium]